MEAMIQGLVDGTIDAIATDHAPHARLDKEAPFQDAASGVIGMETAIPLSWELLVRGELISKRRLVELFTVNPSRILKLGKGTLLEGVAADVTVIDPDREVTIDVSQFRSKARNCPFHGWEAPWGPRLDRGGREDRP